jgi:hypothetical protein
VPKYTRFLAKLEKVLADAGVEPDKLPAFDATVPGLRFLCPSVNDAHGKVDACHQAEAVVNSAR